MKEFLTGYDLWANIVGGAVTAALLALVAYLWNLRKHKILRDLTIIMGRAIEHRNIGESRSFSDESEWIQKAKNIEHEAISKAKQLSTTAGSLVEWLDRITPWGVNNEVEKYVSILSKIIERIRGLLETHS